MFVFGSACRASVFVCQQLLLSIHVDSVFCLSALISTFPAKLLSPTPRLRQFSAITAGSKYHSLLGLPDDLFAYTPDMQRIIIYGHRNLTEFPATIFKGLSKCEIISFVSCGFTNDGFPDDVFSDLTSLKFFDFFGNQLTKVEQRWFQGGWGKNILRLALDTNQITKVESGAFDSLEDLEVVYLHRNADLLTISKSLLANNKKLRHMTLQGNQDFILPFRDQ